MMILILFQLMCPERGFRTATVQPTLRVGGVRGRQYDDDEQRQILAGHCGESVGRYYAD